MSSVATSAGSRHEPLRDDAPLPFAAIDGLVHTKTILLTADPAAADPVAAKRAEILAYFHRTCELDERLFDLIRHEAAFFVRHEPLRHPPIFYLAHPATFYVNKLYVARGRAMPRVASGKAAASPAAVATRGMSATTSAAANARRSRG